jgi:hypothetical protein
MIGIAQGIDNVASFAKIFEACRNIHNCPQIGDPHPAIPTAYLIKIELLSVSSEQVKARFVYDENFNVPQVTTTDSLIQEEVNLDKAGNIMFTAYTYPDDYKLNAAVKGQLVKQGGFVGKLVPQTALRFNVRQFLNPEQTAADFIGKRNEKDWRGVDDAGRWLCTNVSGFSPDGGIIWDNVFSFQKRARKWEGSVVFIDPNTSRPPDDIIISAEAQEPPQLPPADEDPDKGHKIYQIYEEIDFTELPF